jgi:hypothetical protein
MKRFLLALICFLPFVASLAQETDITGTWKEFEMTYKTAQGDQKMTEDQMKEQGFTTEFSFMEGGKFSQSSNMDGSGTMRTFEGTWKKEGDKVTISLNYEGKTIDIVWDFGYKDNVMTLSRSNPEGTFSIVNAFRRKV